MQPQAYCLHRSFEPAEPALFNTQRHYLLYALQGTIRLEADGKRWTLPPTRAALIRAGHPITITVLSKLTSAAVLFSPAFMEPPHEVLSVFDMSPLAQELVRECREWGPENGPLTPYATRIFETLADVVLLLSQTPSDCVLPAPVSPMLKKAVQLTEDKASEEMSFSDLARLSHQSPRALARRFSEEMNMTWREVRRHIRIMNALDALATTQDQITEIALSVGYNSLSGFNAAFREQMQMSPSAYRASRLR